MDKTKKTICWNCALSGYGNVSECPWEREFKPVDGWTAERSDILFGNGCVKCLTESYCVIKCPLFVAQKKTEKVEKQIDEIKNEKEKTHRSWQRISAEEIARRARALKKCRAYHGLTQTQFARKIGISASTYKNYDADSVRCTFDTERVSAAFPDILDFLEEEYED